MPKTLSAAAVLIAGVVLLGTSSARAVTLLSLVNPPTTLGTLYDFSFTATAPATEISIGGYDHPGFEYVFDISVTLGGGENLLERKLGAYTGRVRQRGHAGQRIVDVRRHFFGKLRHVLSDLRDDPRRLIPSVVSVRQLAFPQPAGRVEP